MNKKIQFLIIVILLAIPIVIALAIYLNNGDQRYEEYKEGQNAKFDYVFDDTTPTTVDWLKDSIEDLGIEMDYIVDISELDYNLEEIKETAPDWVVAKLSSYPEENQCLLYAYVATVKTFGYVPFEEAEVGSEFAVKNCSMGTYSIDGTDYVFFLDGEMLYIYNKEKEIGKLSN